MMAYMSYASLVQFGPRTTENCSKVRPPLKLDSENVVNRQ